MSKPITLEQLQQKIAEDLTDFFNEIVEAQPELEQEIATSFLNFSLKSILFSSSSSEMAEITTSSLTAWLTFSRKLMEQEMAEADPLFEQFELVSSSSDAPDPELLFMDIEGLDPN
tara:strand:- start:4359 stop:4706 length:348 start_codon:yes stop_codon:yes gene_type:complete